MAKRRPQALARLKNEPLPGPKIAKFLAAIRNGHTRVDAGYHAGILEINKKLHDDPILMIRCREAEFQLKDEALRMCRDHAQADPAAAFKWGRSFARQLNDEREESQMQTTLILSFQDEKSHPDIIQINPKELSHNVQ